MSSKRVDIRTSRKSNPVLETLSAENPSRVLRQTRNVKKSTKSPKLGRRHVSPLKKPKTVKKILKKNKFLAKSEYAKRKLVPLKESDPPNSTVVTDESKPRRRRLDAEDYIKRRFLYEDESVTKRPRNKSNFIAKRMTQLSPRFRTGSTAALMAASSANLLHRKRRRHHEEGTAFSQYVLLPPARSRRGRKPKQLSDYDLMDNKDTLDEFLPSADQGSETDEQTFSDGGANHNGGGFSHRDAHLQRHERPMDDSNDILKPLFRKTSKSRSYRHHDQSFSAEELNDSPDHFAEFNDLMLQDRMTDLTRTRGPTALSKRARHRIAPRPMRKPESLKQVSHYDEKDFDDFGPHRPSDSFSHQQLQHPDMAPMDHFTEDLGDGIELSSKHSDGSKLSFPLAVGGHPVEMVGMHHHSQLINPDDGSSLAPQLQQQAVDVEEFAGDLLPQRMAPPTTGSSRRKSPIRPMQVMRTESLIYHDPIGDRTNRDTRPYVLEPMRHPRYVGSSGANLIQQNQISIGDGGEIFAENQQQSQQQHSHPGLVDLCAAAHGELADMHSAAAASMVEDYNTSSSSQQQQQQLAQPPQQHGLVDFISQVGNIASTPNSTAMLVQPQPISVVTPNLVSVQPSRIYLETPGGAQNLGLTSFGVPTKSVTKYNNFTTNKAYSTPTGSTTSGGGVKSNSGNSTRRRPTILKRGAVGGAVSSGTTPPSTLSQQQQQQQLNAQTIISYTSIGNTANLPLISPANATRLQPPFMRTISAFTPGATGIHKISLVNTNGAVGGGGGPSDHLIFPDGNISAGGGGQVFRLVTANNTGPSAVTYAVVSAAPSLVTTASPSLIGNTSINNNTSSTTTQTASSRLFGRRPQGTSVAEARGIPQPLTFISNASIGGASLSANQRATPLRCTVVRGAADGKKYVLLGQPPGVIQQPENSSAIQMSTQEIPETDPMESQPQVGVGEEDAEALQFAPNWSGPATTANDSSVVLSSQKPPSPGMAIIS